MGYISYEGKTKIYGTDIATFRIIKVRDDWACCKCRTPIGKGNYCWGNGWTKFCINCGLEVSKEFVEALNSFSSDIEKKVKEVEKNKKEYIKNNIIANL